jgi:hypothetical protein
MNLSMSIPHTCDVVGGYGSALFSRQTATGFGAAGLERVDTDELASAAVAAAQDSGSGLGAIHIANDDQSLKPLTKADQWGR